MAQLEEHATSSQEDMGSIPALATSSLLVESVYRYNVTD